VLLLLLLVVLLVLLLPGRRAAASRNNQSQDKTGSATELEHTSGVESPGKTRRRGGEF
jgi:hypothetical protein